MSKLYTGDTFLYPGAILLTETEMSAPAFEIDDWGGALISGVPLSQFNAFLTKETTIELVGKVNCRLVEVPGKNGNVLAGYSINSQNMSLVIHTYLDNWPEDEDPRDVIEQQVSDILSLLNPGKGSTEIVLEEYYNMKFKVLQKEGLEIDPHVSEATIKISLDIL